MPCSRDTFWQKTKSQKLVVGAPKTSYFFIKHKNQVYNANCETHHEDGENHAGQGEVAVWNHLGPTRVSKAFGLQRIVDLVDGNCNMVVISFDY